MRHHAAAAALVLTLAACTTPTTAPTTSPATGEGPDVPADARSATVERVVDGDTLVVELDGDRERVRLLRIDTPELARDGAPHECLAEEAARALASLLPAGTSVELATDVEARDRFDRLLAHVWVDDTWVNGALLREGWAQVLTIPPNVAHTDAVLAAADAARADGRGLWSATACPD